MASRAPSYSEIVHFVGTDGTRIKAWKDVRKSSGVAVAVKRSTTAAKVNATQEVQQLLRVLKQEIKDSGVSARGAERIRDSFAHCLNTGALVAVSPEVRMSVLQILAGCVCLGDSTSTSTTPAAALATLVQAVVFFYGWSMRQLGGVRLPHTAHASYDATTALWVLIGPCVLHNMGNFCTLATAVVGTGMVGWDRVSDLARSKRADECAEWAGNKAKSDAHTVLQQQLHPHAGLEVAPVHVEDGRRPW